MINHSYNITLHPKEGKVNLQVQVDNESGDIKFSVFVNNKKGDIIKSVFTLDSDMDSKTVIETLRWARLKSLKAKGFKVVM